MTQLILEKKTVNARLKEEVSALKGVTYDDIESETGVSRSTWMRMTKPGASVKIEHIDVLSSKFDIDGDYIKTGVRGLRNSETVTPGAHIEEKGVRTSEQIGKESVQTSAHSNEVMEEQRDYVTDLPASSEEKIAALIERIEQGPWSVAVKLKMVESMIRLIEQSRDQDSE